ncbi:MAG TPA: pilus assembly PilX N-terminal domain-containing protein [Gemmatimonadales bacterium]|nr:pilus assembly PilX N-terminal domain-containing protein [Gemmatimonadales bacterium]
MRHAPDLKNERGIALAMAVFALVVIGAIVAGTVFAGRLEQRGGQNTIYAGQAFEAADAGVNNTIADWSPSYNQLTVGDSVVLATTTLGASASATGVITRVNDITFLVRSDGEAHDVNGNVLAQRSVATMAKLIVTDVPIRAAVAARGDLTMKGTADIYGANADPPDWSSESGERSACPFDNTSVPAAELSGELHENGNPTHTPSVIENSTELTDDMFSTPFDALAEMADLTLNWSGASPAPTTVGSPAKCDASNLSNWGEPGTSVTACQNYFPIIHFTGNVSLNGGRGQGILLVDGNLTLAGNFVFAGIIITKGSFDASHGTNDIYGAVLANNATLDDMVMAGTPQVQFSTCAISRALNASAKAKPFGSRAWAQLY